MQQKLISIFFASWDKLDTGTKHQLEEFLADEWIVKSVTPIGSTGNTSSACGWALVLLERED
jgi:hypothetical protein